MTQANGKQQREILDRPRARRNASKVLAIALQTRLRRLYDAQNNNVEDEIVIATADLAQCMYENIEFVIWALKTEGGLNPPPPDQLRRITPVAAPANDDPRFAKPPELKLADESPVAAECTCPPLEHGIIGRDKHMTSCPLYVP